MIQSTENQLGTIYTSIAQRLADGILPTPTPSDLESPKTKINEKSKYIPPSQTSNRHDFITPSSLSSK